MKLRPTEEELKTIGPDFTARWKEYFVNAPDKPILYIGPLAVYADLVLSVVETTLTL